MFVTVIHRIHDPEGFEKAEAKALRPDFPPVSRCRFTRPLAITTLAFASGKLRTQSRRSA